MSTAVFKRMCGRITSGMIVSFPWGSLGEWHQCQSGMITCTWLAEWLITIPELSKLDISCSQTVETLFWRTSDETFWLIHKVKKKNLKFSVCTSQSIAAPVDWSRMWMWHVHYQERSRNTGGGHLLNSISLMAWPCSPLPSMVFFLFFLGACTATSSVSSCFCFPGGWSAWPLGPCPPEHLKGTTVPSKALPALSYCLIIIPI